MNVVFFSLSRLLQLIPVLLGITLVAFLLLRVMPGDPATLMLGSRGTPEDIAALTRQLGLDRPLWLQYLSFLSDIVQGSFGRSIAYKTQIGPLLIERLWPTLALVGLSTVFALIMTVPLALYTAVRRNSLADHAVKFFFVAAMSMPPFWLGVLLVLLLSIVFPVFPVSGYGKDWLDRLHHLTLPAIIIALGTAALTIRSLRSSVIAVLGADYVDTARAKGLPEGTVIWRHVLRNSLTSTISVLAVHTSWVIGGTVVIETVFGIPGLGSLLVSSISARDYPLVQGLTVTFAVLVVLINLLADIAYSIVDPRVSLS
ncbi:ABC transporter permease [Labrys monachus]|uniref:Peptide/nickel transport system permease protein n=1 Tax=Labrys monachus TaxID=217067 RepID=A0ABU0F928_9HYPH|nr:ABC transporter permease [Labrys monachus]MDQ0391121.1 peptide/nickel transport system permease protein [Labrys monachus]